MTRAEPGFGPRNPYPRTATLPELFALRVAVDPGATALIAGRRRVSYGELDEMSACVAAGLEPADGPIIGLYADRGVEAVAGMLGILKAGAAYLPLDPTDPAARTVHMLSRVGVRTVLAAAHLTARVAPGNWRVAPLQLDRPGTRRPGPAAVVKATDPAYVMFTSGSTGDPKAVCVPHRAISRLVVNTDYLELSPSDVLLHAAPLTFDASTFEIWGALLTGAAAAIVPSAVPSVRELGLRIATDRVSVAWLPSSLFREVVRHDISVLEPLRALVTGGEVASFEAICATLSTVAGLTLINAYGPTEATTFTTAHVMTAERLPTDPVPIGKPLANTAVYLLDAGLQPVPRGDVGELFVGGDGVALGYLGDPEATARSFLPAPPELLGSQRLYRTGDLARLSEDGLLQFVGRTDRQLKVRGFRVEPAELEAAILRMPEVRDAVALPYDSPSGRQLIAYVVAESSVTESSVTESAVSEAERGAANRVSHWRGVYDSIVYDDLSAGSASGDPLFNTQGWRSSYDGRPIPAAQMREQVDQAVERIMSIRPRRVLEIGCGTGMLLFRMLPDCERYVGTDFSATALDYVRRQLGELTTECRITLRQLEAADLGPLGDERFDAVVLNSIVQHFPSPDYLRAVLVGAIDRVADGGVVFVGDVRSRSGLPLFHTSVVLAQAQSGTTVRQVRHEVSRRVAEERELCIDPGFFGSASLPRLAGLRFDAKRGEANEMTLFRYDTRLYVGRASEPAVPAVSTEWGSEVPDVAALEAALEQRRPAVFECRAIPDPRCEAERVVLSVESPDLATVADLHAWLGRRDRTGREPGPEQLRAIADAHGAQVQVAPSAGRPGHWDATFYPREAGSGFPAWVRSPASVSPASVSSAEWRRHTNDPLAGERRRRLASSVIEHLRTSVPRYLVPARVMVLDAIPLTSSGKVDVARLPPPRDTTVAGTRRSPSTTTTAGRLGQLCEELLGVPVLDSDNIFDSGADSLAVIQLVARIETELNVRVSPVTVYEHPVLIDLADAIDSASVLPAEDRPDDVELAGHRREVAQRIAERAEARRLRGRRTSRQ